MIYILTHIFVIPEIITSAKSINNQADKTTFIPAKINTQRDESTFIPAKINTQRDESTFIPAKISTQRDESTFIPTQIIPGTIYNSFSNIHWPVTAGVVIVIVFCSIYVLFR